MIGEAQYPRNERGSMDVWALGLLILGAVVVLSTSLIMMTGYLGPQHEPVEESIDPDKNYSHKTVGVDDWGKQKLLGPHSDQNIPTVDPDIVHRNGTYYACGGDSWNTRSIWSAPEPDAESWTHHGVVFDTSQIEEQRIGDCGLAEANGTWYLFMSVGDETDNAQTTNRIIVAKSTKPTGEYTYLGGTGVSVDSVGDWGSGGVGEPDLDYSPMLDKWVLSISGYNDTHDGHTHQPIGLAVGEPGAFTEMELVDANPVVNDPTFLAVDQEIQISEDGYIIYYNYGNSKDIKKASSTTLTKFAIEGVVSKSGGWQYDQDGMYSPEVITINNTTHVWYNGDTNGTAYLIYGQGNITYPGESDAN